MVTIGLAIQPIRSLIINPDGFHNSILAWARARNITLDPNEVYAFLGADLNPEKATLLQFITMITNPTMAICDPTIVASMIEAKNMTTSDIQVNWQEFMKIFPSTVQSFIHLFVF